MSEPDVCYVIADLPVDHELRATSISVIRARLARWWPAARKMNSASQQDCDIVIELSAFHPFIDEMLLGDMIAASWATGHSFHAVDAIPGTAPLAVKRTGAAESPTHPFFSTMQPTFSTNLSIRRPNRAWIFRQLTQQFADLCTRPLRGILEFLESDPGIDFVIGYGHPVPVQRYEDCPHCQSSSVRRLHSGTSHPIQGFLTKNISLYSHCQQCGLTFMSRQLRREDLRLYYQDYSYAAAWSVEDATALFGNLSEKSVSHFANYSAVLGTLKALGGNSQLLDIGAGGGEFVVYCRSLLERCGITAIDWRFAPVVMDVLAHYRIDCVSGDLLLSLAGFREEGRRFSFISAWEVIEHLKIEDLLGFFHSVRDVLSRDGLLVISTPDFFDLHCGALDFWSMAPGEHISVLSRRFLEPLLADCGLAIVREQHESVMLKSPGRWFAFGAETNAHFSMKAAAAVIDGFLADDEARERYRQACRDRGIGSELILTIGHALPD